MYKNRIKSSVGLMVTALLLSICLYVFFLVYSSLYYTSLFHRLFPINNFEILVKTILSVAVIYSFALIVFFVKPGFGFSIKEYCALRKVTLKQVIFWSVVTIIFEVVSNVLYNSMDMSMASWWVEELLQANVSHLLWFLAVLLCAPLLEELLFRGVLFTGIAQSPLGVPAAVLITSFLWTAPFASERYVNIVYIFFYGLILGIARAKTKSVTLPIIMHFLVSFLDIVAMLTIYTGQKLF